MHVQSSSYPSVHNYEPGLFYFFYVDRLVSVQYRQMACKAGFIHQFLQYG